ncbi:MAG: hypothetical protein O7A98_06180 [Acidobacteria bacterium]|nr:hypothetical protein [Acidobacteriota bacterium]
MTGWACGLSFFALIGRALDDGTGLERWVSGCSSLVILLPLGAFMGWLTVRLWRTGKYIQELRNYRYCVVSTWWMLLVFPLGTMVGGGMLLLLQRESVKAAFADADPEAAIDPG